MKCKICSSDTQIFFLGEAPMIGYICDDLNESMIQPKFPLELLYCNECGLLHYNEIEEANDLLNRFYTNYTSTFHIYKEFENYLNGFVDKIFSKQKNICNVLEIGCNDGYILDLFRNKKPDIKLFGVEPSSKFDQIWKERNINIYNNYFDASTTDYFNNMKFDVIFFRHVFEHIFDPIQFFENVTKISDSNTLIVIEVPYLKSVIKNKRIENIGYQHSNYFTITSINNIINRFGYDIVEFEEVYTDGGSIVVYIRKVDEIGKKTFSDKVPINDIINLIEYIITLKIKVKTVLSGYTKNELIGYGAGGKGQNLIHMLNMENSIDRVIDDTPDYNNKYIPGTKINILNPTKQIYDGIKAVLNLVPTHHKVIKNKIPQNIDFIDFINE